MDISLIYKFLNFKQNICKLQLAKPHMRNIGKPFASWIHFLLASPPPLPPPSEMVSCLLTQFMEDLCDLEWSRLAREGEEGKGGTVCGGRTNSVSMFDPVFMNESHLVRSKCWEYRGEFWRIFKLSRFSYWTTRSWAGVLWVFFHLNMGRPMFISVNIS